MEKIPNVTNKFAQVFSIIFFLIVGWFCFLFFWESKDMWTSVFLRLKRPEPASSMLQLDIRSVVCSCSFDSVFCFVF